MKRGVGVKFQCQFLSLDKLRQWLFDNVGEVGTQVSGCLVSKNETWYYTYSDVINILRIGMWTELSVEEAWEQIKTKAPIIAKECECNLTIYGIDLYEYDEEVQGVVNRYDDLVGGELAVISVKPEEAPKKEQRWN